MKKLSVFFVCMMFTESFAMEYRQKVAPGNIVSSVKGVKVFRRGTRAFTVKVGKGRKNVIPVEYDRMDNPLCTASALDENWEKFLARNKIKVDPYATGVNPILQTVPKDT